MISSTFTINDVRIQMAFGCGVLFLFLLPLPLLHQCHHVYVISSRGQLLLYSEGATFAFSTIMNLISVLETREDINRVSVYLVCMLTSLVSLISTLIQILYDVNRCVNEIG